METKQSLLISKVFRAKYSNKWFGNSLKGKISKTDMWGSRSIMKAVMDMAEGVGYLLGDGRTTLILEDTWVASKGRINIKEENFSQLRNRPFLVQDLISNRGRWDET